MMCIAALFLFLVWIEVSICIGYTVITKCILHSAAVNPVAVRILCHGNVISLVIIETVGTSGVAIAIVVIIIVVIIIVVIIAVIIVTIIITVIIIVIIAVIFVSAAVVAVWIIIAVIIRYSILTKRINNTIAVYPVSAAVFVDTDQIALIIIKAVCLNIPAIIIAAVIITAVCSIWFVIRKICTIAVCDAIRIKIVNGTAAVYPVSVAVLIYINSISITVINILTIFI